MPSSFFVYLSSCDGGCKTGLIITKDLIPLTAEFHFSTVGDGLSSDPITDGSVGSSDAGVSLRTGPAGSYVKLEGFSASTEKGETGSGEKAGGDGTFPDGTLTWICDDVV